MNTVIIFVCVLAAALASPGFAGLGAYSGQYAGPYAAQAYGGYYGGHYAGPLASGLTVAPVGRLVDPAAIAAGAPLPTGDTVEVAHAKAEHFQAYATEAARNGAISYAAHATPLAYNYGGQYAAQAYGGYYGGHYAGPLASGLTVAPVGRLVDPAAIAAGAPLPTGDTVEVAHAKAEHFQAYATEASRNGVISYAAHAAPLAYAHASPLAYNYAHAAPLAYSHGHVALATEARLVDPVAIAAGAPLPTGDTVEVAAAKAAHYQAHAVARAGHLRYKRGLAYAATPLAYAAYAPRSYGYSSVTAHTSPLAYGAHTAVAYNAPLVAAAYPVARSYAAYAPQSYAAYAPQSYAYSSPISHYSSVW